MARPPSIDRPLERLRLGDGERKAGHLRNWRAATMSAATFAAGGVMRYFLHTDAQGKWRGAWQIDAGVAQRLGVANPQATQNAYVVAAPQAGETDLDALRRQIRLLIRQDGPTSNLIETKLAPGEFYPRIARPLEQHPNESPGIYPGIELIRDKVVNAQGQLVALALNLENICQVVHPTGPNLEAFGHEIRNLLILACTEAEAHWRGVLEENSISPSNGRDFTTVDYVKLTDAMRLKDYGARFPYYPWLPVMRPFEIWGTTGSPTKELPWYASYNAIKHDREKEFARATLLHAFHAVTACAIMVYAQYGMTERVSFFVGRLNNFVEITEVPRWSPADVYIHPYTSHGLLGTWTPTLYPF